MDNFSVFQDFMAAPEPSNVNQTDEPRAIDAPTNNVISVAQEARQTAEALKISASPANYRDLGLSLIPESELKQKLVSFVDMAIMPPENSLEPITAFLEDKERSDWHSHDDVLKGEWENFCMTIAEVSHGEVELGEMAAPSGPRRARMTMLWHYPTFTSGNCMLSHVMDPDSPSLKIQEVKIGLPRDVRTQDLLPTRYKCDRTQSKLPEWEKKYTHWPAIRQACYNFNRTLMSDDRFIVVMGEHTFVDIEPMIKERGCELQSISLAIDKRMFNKEPCIYLAVDSSGEVQKVIFHLWHGEYAYHNTDPSRGALWDLLWNMACEFAGVPVRNHGYLAWKAGAMRERERDLSALAPTITGPEMDKKVRLNEQRDNQAYSVDQIISFFPELIKAHPEMEAEIRQAQLVGHRPSSVPEKFFRQQGTDNKAKRRLAEMDPNPRPAKAPMTDEAKKWSEHPSIIKGRSRDEVIETKYHVFMATYEVRTALANRGKFEYSKAIEKIDALQKLYERRANQALKTKLSNELTRHVAFYHEVKWPGGYPYLPEHPPLTNPNQNHPAVKLAGFRGKDKERVPGLKGV